MTWTIVITIFGLALFEIISSIDNAVVNAHVLATLPQKYRKFFLTWGLFLAVVVIRGGLPFVLTHLTSSRAVLLIAGGMYLALVFLGWLFLEEKKYAFFVEHFIHRQSVWFYAVTSILFTGVIYWALQVNPILALGASIGSMAFFITDGFRTNAAATEKKLESSVAMSAISKLLYLEVLDASFSIDGVVGAFAFTVSVPLIILGNGIGALVVREVTVRGGAWVSRYAYLKNGAMYSIGMLGALMVIESFGHEFPFWLAPLNTVLLLAVFLYLSYREVEEKKKI